MQNPTESLASLIDTSILVSVVRQILKNETLEITNWDFRQITRGLSGSAVYRLCGEAICSEGRQGWSLVLKILRQSGKLPVSIQHYNYWKREACFFQSGYLEEMESDFHPVRCYRSSEHRSADGGREIWLWFEDLLEDKKFLWSVEAHSQAARFFGQLNGLPLVSDTFSREPWLSVGYLRDFVEKHHSLATRGLSVPGNPLVHFLGKRLVAELMRAMHNRDYFFEILDLLPQTLCHFDAHCGNIFFVDSNNLSSGLKVLDWARFGHGPIGSEVTSLLISSLNCRRVALKQARELERTIFSEYVNGLYDVGWQGDPNVVRLGYTAGMIRHLFYASKPWLKKMRDDPSEIEHFVSVQEFVLSLLDEVSELRESLNLGF